MTAAPEVRAPSQGSDPRPARSPQIVLAFLLVFAIYAMSGVTDFSDSALAVPTANSLLYNGDLDLSEYAERHAFADRYALREVEGRHVDYFPWLTSVFAVPVVALWDLLAGMGLTTSSSELIGTTGLGPLQILAGSTWAAAAAVALALVADRLRRMVAAGVSGPPRGGVLPALPQRWVVPGYAVVIGLGTSLWSTASRGMWQHGPSLLLCALAVLCTLRALDAPERAGRAEVTFAAAGAFAALSYWVRPTNVVLCAVLVLWLARRRPRALVPLAGGAAATTALLVPLNLALLGTVLPPYFQASRIGWHGDLPQAMAANLVSPSRGLFVFSPFLLAALVFLGRRRRGSLPAEVQVVVTTFLLGALGYLVAVSAYGERWWAGESFGPRFMSESIVLLAPLALLVIFGPLPARAGSEAAGTSSLPVLRGLAVALMAWSVLVRAQGALLVEVRCWNKEPVNVDLEPSRVWDLGRPQVTEGLRLAAGGDLAGSDGRCVV